ncbi:MAG: hypothetical protein NTX91_01025 [candidate division SR1 bacterium]|nr:hypothetical protein [candidate division SR1 bacterium]
MIKTLAIETSCDDTSISIVSFDGNVFTVEKLLAYSQIDDHQKYGGVVPEFASRLHSEKIIAVLQNIGRDEIQKTDFISVTTHPGLPGSLVVGKAVAAFLAKHFDKPLVEVNHVYGHLFSLLLERNVHDIQFPLVVLTASGGHNDIYVVDDGKLSHGIAKIENGELERKEFGGYHIARLGKTLDDAAGECFDKVSRMLGGPYPGGRWIDDKASCSHKARKVHKVESQKDFEALIDLKTGRPEDSIDVSFKRIFLSHDGYDFSFSGMKSQTSFLLNELEKKGIPLTEELICDIAYEFQEAVIEVLVKKLLRAAIQYGAKTVGVAGGVSCSERLRAYLNERGVHEQMKGEKVEILKDVQFLRPIKKIYSTDNGAMIGLAGILKWMENG